MRRDWTRDGRPCVVRYVYHSLLSVDVCVDLAYRLSDYQAKESWSLLPASRQCFQTLPTTNNTTITIIISLNCNRISWTNAHLLASLTPYQALRLR